MADRSRIEELRRRVQLDPASIAFAALAEEYRRAGQFEEAIAACKAGLQRHPAYLSARVTLGRALLELGRFDEARRELGHVLRAAPENLAAIRGLAEIHGRGTDYPDAARPYTGTDPARSEAAVEPAPAPVRAPATPVAMSAPADAAIPVPASISIPTPPPRAVAPSISLSMSAPAPVVPPPHPDEAALPGLEAFLAALVATGPPSRS